MYTGKWVSLFLCFREMASKHWSVDCQKCNRSPKTIIQLTWYSPSYWRGIKTMCAINFDGLTVDESSRRTQQETHSSRHLWQVDAADYYIIKVKTPAVALLTWVKTRHHQYFTISEATADWNELLPSPPLSERRHCDGWRQAVCVRHISLGGEGNARYPVLSSWYCVQLCITQIYEVLPPKWATQGLHTVQYLTNSMKPPMHSVIMA